MLLVHLLESDPQLRVIGAVGDGQAALDFVEATLPDVVVMDIHMPSMDGFEATRRIMETHPVPIIICTATTDPQEVATMFQLMEAGAVACIEKPIGPESAAYATRAANLVQTVKLMSEVKVVRRWPRARAVPTRAADPSIPRSAAPVVKIVGIGASTGGPPALQTILAGLSDELTVPILIVQHIAQGFLPGFVEWLSQSTSLRIHIAAHGTRPLAAHVYLAPDGYNMGVGADGSIQLNGDATPAVQRPAVSYLFRTLADVYGASAMGVLLTGMGKDGAAELKLMKDRGAVTIAQDRESSVVHGMPGEAIALGGATLVLPPEKIADAIRVYVGASHSKGNIR